MTANLYCSRGDVNRRLPAGSLDGPSRLVDSALAATDVFVLDGHGLETDDALNVRAAEGGSLPAPLVAGTTYYAIRLTNATFKVAASPGGSPIDLSSDGSSVVVSRAPDYDSVIEYYSRWADTFLPREVVPLTSPIHPLVKGLVVDLSAKRLLNLDGKDSKIIDVSEMSAKAQLERLATGIPLRAPVAGAPANLAVVASITTTDPRGWGSGTIP
jgi:hypothetical protein